MATPQGAAWVPHTRAGLEPGIAGFLTLCINHYATRGRLYDIDIQYTDSMQFKVRLQSIGE